MTILTIFALILAAMLVASLIPARAPAPAIIIVQAIEPQADEGTGCLPLLLFVAAVIAAVALF